MIKITKYNYIYVLRTTYIYADKGFAPFSFRHELKMLTITLIRDFINI